MREIDGQRVDFSGSVRLLESNHWFDATRRFWLDYPDLPQSWCFSDMRTCIQWLFGSSSDEQVPTPSRIWPDEFLSGEDLTGRHRWCFDDFWDALLSWKLEGADFQCQPPSLEIRPKYGRNEGSRVVVNSPRRRLAISWGKRGIGG